MTNIFLVRHGQKASELGDPGLTEIGKKQAIEVGNFIKDTSFDKILVSPYKRTIETADQIISVIGGEYEFHNDLVERMEWSEELTREEFISEWVKATRDRDYIPKVGDSSRKTGERMKTIVDKYSKDAENVLLVTHGGAIIDYLRTIFGDEEIIKLRKRFPSGYGYEILNCSVSKIIMCDENKIDLLNYTEHLSNVSE